MQKSSIKYLLTMSNNTVKRITDLNVKYKAKKILKDNIGENLGDTAFSSDFLDTTPKA
jgi:hypothetical protein